MVRRQILVVDCGTALKEKFHTIISTNLREEDEESLGSSYHITIVDRNDVEEEDAKDAPP